MHTSNDCVGYMLNDLEVFERTTLCWDIKREVKQGDALSPILFFHAQLG